MSVIGVIGGTGQQGAGLAYRFALAGHDVVLGSRSGDRAERAAERLNALVPSGPPLTGTTNDKAAEAGSIVLLAVPYGGHAELVTSLRPYLAGKIIISCANPIGFDRRGPFAAPVPSGSAAEEAAALLPESTVIGAFHHVSAVSLAEDGPLNETDVLVCGDDPTAKRTVRDLARAVTGLAGVDAGPLRAARQLEGLTVVLIEINKRYKIRSGVMVGGLPR